MKGVTILRLAIVLVLVMLLVGAAVGWNSVKAHFIEQAKAQNASVPQTVSTATAEYSEWQPQVQAVGSLRAIHGVEVTTEVAGLVRAIAFKSGADAQSGQILVQLNADPDMAQLRALMAEANLAALTYHRDLIQYQAQAIGRAQLDTDIANLKSAREQEAAQAALVRKRPSARLSAGGSASPRSTRGSTSIRATRSSPWNRSIRSTSISACPRIIWRSLRWARQSTWGSMLIPAQPSRARSRPSTRRSIPPRAMCRSRPRAQSRAQAAAGMFAAPWSTPAPRQRHLSCRKRLSPITPMAPPCSSSNEHAPQRAGQNAAGRTAGVRHARPDARRPGRDPEGRRGRDGRDQRAAQAQERHAARIDNRVQPANSPNPTPQEHESAP